MKLATRINSFLPKFNNSVEEVLQEFNRLGLTHVDFNYPEHVIDISAAKMKEMVQENNLLVNGVALRFRDEFINGELGNADSVISDRAVELCKEACDYCRNIGGEVVTIWLGFDGFDYSFQIDYEKVWNQIKDCLIQIADYAPDLKISIEYKPFQPRAYAFLDSFGVSLSMIHEVGRENLGITLDYCHMLMKHENPAYGASILGSRKKLFGVHLNDGYGLNDDGLMIGTNSLIKTIEFIYYTKLHSYEYAFYFDTFPVIEDPIAECKRNIKMIKKIDSVIDKLGMNYISDVIKENSGVKVSDIVLEILA
ncbi:AP endonuclease [Carnobacterium maltaromaticum]|uniref:sugar phosphate isomerase/epimerase family protein n=1 Tax=Carnobacterium maltaromaticum TaxID=2751 RepID=UPI000C78E581|nr:sugar phosphate isomerase/epimerase family protein [Carnobacterium maltaromaticum]PLS38108.1 AP endonuclease [Carnobacterium maltaromaticum]PLS38485.1 AP endonuclease [Carnobacterium maltaromaticum]PLS38862.1 AP endonuclease [Carnobacterium maltaromaticum]PLS45132.1 AP endonuclease [Carnobacterium maltaromaticum]PLS47988.1 AP endonuclease [Carnobacterium maltaromaticum]